MRYVVRQSLSGLLCQHSSRSAATRHRVQQSCACQQKKRKVYGRATAIPPSASKSALYSRAFCSIRAARAAPPPALHFISNTRQISLCRAAACHKTPIRCVTVKITVRGATHQTWRSALRRPGRLLLWATLQEWPRQAGTCR